MKGRRSNVIGVFAGMGLVLGIFSWMNRKSESWARTHATGILETTRTRGISHLTDGELGSQARQTLLDFERERGKADRFELGPVQTFFGIGPSVVQGTVFRRGKALTFNVVFADTGRVVSYHEG